MPKLSALSVHPSRLVTDRQTDTNTDRTSVRTSEGHSYNLSRAGYNEPEPLGQSDLMVKQTGRDGTLVGI